VNQTLRVRLLLENISNFQFNQGHLQITLLIYFKHQRWRTKLFGRREYIVLVRVGLIKKLNLHESKTL